jgi:hypothetical protein
MVLSASIVLTLGIVHLVYTFWGPNLTPRDPALQISMSQISPVITKETTMWRAWVGFNASHSMGLILFGLVFGYLALAHGQLLFQSPFLLAVGLAMLVGFVVLCKLYFFARFLSASASLWPALLPVLRYRGANNAVRHPVASPLRSDRANKPIDQFARDRFRPLNRSRGDSWIQMRVRISDLFRGHRWGRDRQFDSVVDKFSFQAMYFHDDSFLG